MNCQIQQTWIIFCFLRFHFKLKAQTQIEKLSLRRYSTLGLIVDLDLLFCTGFDLGHADLFQYLILLKDWWIIERLSQAMSNLLVCTILWQNSWNFFFKWEKKLLSLPVQKNYKTSKPFWLSKWTSSAKVASILHCLQGLPLTQKHLCLLRLTSAASQIAMQILCWNAAPRAWPLILQSKTLISFWNCD